MLWYNVYHDDIRVGVLTISKEGKYRYDPDKKAIKAIAESGRNVLNQLSKHVPYCDSIPFFEEALKPETDFATYYIIKDNHRFR